MASELEKLAARAVAEAGGEHACLVIGHEWVFSGGCNAGCEMGRDCSCSISVNECPHCGDFDYGENEEAEEIRQRCRHERCAD